MAGTMRYLLILTCVFLIGFCECKLKKRKGRSAKDDGKSSLVFVFDTTGSMHNDLRQLREGAEMILNTAIKESDVIADFVFVPFHDPLVGPATVTKSKHNFKAALNNVRVYGGGDCPEKSLTGIQLALNVSRPKSFIYVFTDATAGDHRIVGNVLDLIQRKQSQVVFILTGHCNDLTKPTYKVYQQIAAASSGQIFNLKKANVHKVLEFVRSSIKGRTVNLASVSNPAGYNYTQEIPVDSSLGEVTVSVSGAKPQITVVDPKGERLKGPPKLITTLDLSEIMVVKVMQPEPGNYTITVGSEEDYSVKVVGLSNLTFAHGFSVERPKSMAETSYRPLKGTYNHMMLSLTMGNISASMDYAEILDLAGKPKFELSLKEVDPVKKLYLADPFIPPDDFFYVSITGHDQFGRELRRIGATAIEAKLPGVPYLTVAKQVEAHTHTRVVLSCNVESLVPVVAKWTRETDDVQEPRTSLQTFAVEYVIEDMTAEYAGIYRCNAYNVAGQSFADTELVHLVEPPQVTMAPGNLTVDVNDSLTVSCLVSSEALLLKNQLIFNGTMSYLETDIDLEPNIEGYYVYNKTIEVSENDSGLYSCVAENRGGITSQSGYITVISEPTAQILGPHTLSKLHNTGFQVVCHVENAHKIEWRDSKQAVVRDVAVNGTYDDIFNVDNVTEDCWWTCVAMRGSRKASDAVNVTVLIKPEVRITGPRNVTILYGTKYEVECEVRGKPAPRILWHRETEKFLNNTITMVSPNVYKSVLTLDSGKEPVADTYFCFGENAEGIDQDSIVVNVRRKMVLVNGFKDQSVELYHQLDLHCEVDSYPRAFITWRHNGTTLLSRTNVLIAEDNNVVVLKRVDFDDLGLYECEARNGFEELKVNGTVSVVGLASPQLLKDTSRVVTRVGVPGIITCRILNGNPEPILAWQYKSPNSDLFLTPPSDVVVNMAKMALEIPSVTVEHSGTYRCIADNVLGSDTHDVSLVVQFPPKLSKSNDTDPKKFREVKLGEPVTFSCDVIGLPPPIIVWSKDRRPIVYSKNVFLSNVSDLVINKVSAHDSGQYVCNASSTLGSVQRNFTLIVYDPPAIPIPTTDPIQDLVEGQLVELPCLAKGFPTPAVEWTQNGNIINDSKKYIDENGLRFVANVTDFGEYVCTARNAYGNVSVSYSLFIWVPPYIDPPLYSVSEVVAGSNATLKCDVIGFPLPSVQWEFGDEVIEDNRTGVVYRNGDIDILNTTSDDEGLYVCVAENFGGIAKKSVHLKVYEPPKILDDQYIGPYLATDKDSVLTLACRATGKPKPYVLWSKDEFYLDKDPRYSLDLDGTLTIKAPSEDMSGNYTCTANNTVGVIKKTVPVEIYALPTQLPQLQSDEAHATVTLVEGTNATVECPVPASRIDSLKWYKTAQLISTEELNFPNVSRSNASTYSCIAANAVGSAFARTQIVVEWSPQFIVQSSRDVEVIQGDDWSFDCEVDAKPRAKTKWYYNGKLLVFEDKDHLKLMSVHQRKGGLYKCVVSNLHGTVLREFNLTVLVPPVISEFDMLDVQLKEGVNATLECAAKGTPVPNITWTYNNTNWHEEQSSLISTNITTKSEGLFRCDATNRAGTTHLVYRVGVVAAAGIKDIVLYVGGEGVNVEETLEVVIGSNARVACTAKGNPSPDIQWLRQGRVVAQNDDEAQYADLVLNEVQPANAGPYTCVAANEGGTDAKTVKVEVLEPPKIFQDLFQNTNTSNNEIALEVLQGQGFYLHCHPYGNPMPVVYWFKDEIPLKIFDDDMTSLDYGEVVAVKHASENQAGNYTCVARNRLGDTSVTYLVDVLVPPPMPKESSKQVTVRAGTPLQMSCPVEGAPQPIVMWIKHPYTEINENSTGFLLSEDGYNLTKSTTGPEDRGKYSCIMTNKVGTTEVVFDVTIDKPPSIAGNKGSNNAEGYVVPLRRSIVLKCEVDGLPTPKITWLKDTQRLSENLSNIQRVLGNSLLAIWSAGDRDAGQYICVAENTAGTAHRRFNVAVQVPGKWSVWSQWSLCNVTCGLGHQERSRLCHYTDDRNNTIDSSTKSDRIILDESACVGPTIDKRKCHMPPCETDEGQARWSSWSRWLPCSAYCGKGSQSRTRRCKTKAQCIGDNVQIRKCPNLPPCLPEQPDTDNEVYDDDKEDISDINAYSPEVTFEVQPEIDSRYSPNIEEFYRASDSQPPTAYFDVNVTYNLDRSDRGPCDPGFRYNRTFNSCDDIDECLLDTNHCHSTQVCVNTEGAYRCSCTAGYLSLGAGQRCMDINECEQEIDGCEFSCVNTAGGYVCACPRHLRLHLDKHHCVAPSMYKRPFGELDREDEYLSTTIEFPRTKPI